MNKLEEIMRALGYDKVSHFAKFLGKDAGSVNKYVKNKRNIGGGFIFDLKAKIPALNSLIDHRKKLTYKLTARQNDFPAPGRCSLVFDFERFFIHVTM
jgi:hypothetical protein